MSIKVAAGRQLNCVTEPREAGSIDLEILPLEVQEAVLQIRQKLLVTDPDDIEAIESIIGGDWSALVDGPQWAIGLDKDGENPVEFRIHDIDYMQSPAVRTITSFLRQALPKLPIEERLELTERFEPIAADCWKRKEGKLDNK